MQRFAVLQLTGCAGCEVSLLNAEELAVSLPLACDLFDSYWELLVSLKKRINTWGDDAPAYYIAATGENQPDYGCDIIRMMDPDGSEGTHFAAHEFRDHLTYEETDYSYAGKTSYMGEVIRANSLARVNLVHRMGTPRVDEYLDRFREAFGRPAHKLLLYDLARGIELVYAFERALLVAAERYITPERVDMELERAVGRVVRAFDPCIACATH